MLNKIMFFVGICFLGFKTIAQVPGEGINVRGAKIEIAELYEVFSIVGHCKNDEARDYYAKVAGNLDIITTKQGNTVNKGEVLLVIDQAIASAIKSKAKAMLQSAEASYKRNQLLYGKKYISNNAMFDFFYKLTNFSSCVGTRLKDFVKNVAIV